MSRILCLLTALSLPALTGCGEIIDATKEAFFQVRADATAQYQDELRGGLRKQYEGLKDGVTTSGAEYVDQFTSPDKSKTNPENPDY